MHTGICIYVTPAFCGGELAPWYKAYFIPPRGTFKTPWTIIIYSKVVLPFPDWEQTLMKRSSGNNQKRQSSQGHKQPT